MKRAKKLTLTVMAASSATVLAACGDDEQEKVESYSSLEACKAADAFTDEQCEIEFAKAQKTHEESAPRYTNQALCESEFGIDKCQPRTNSNGGSFWSPFFTGYIISSLINNNSGGYYSSPYYNTRYGRRATWNGDPINTYRDSNGRVQHRVSDSAVRAKPKPAKVMNRTAVVSRGGFGARPKARSNRSNGRSRSSWGG